MKLSWIKSDCCLICGNNTVITESVETELNGQKIREHCCGGRWETRKFACGTEIRYIPNFSCEQNFGECKNDISIKERNKKRETALIALVSQIDSLDCDDEYKNRLRSILT